MSLHVSAQHISDAWIQTLETVNSKPHGTATHTLVSISAPQEGTHAEVSGVVDKALRGRDRHGIFTVANTIFPSALYNDPGLDWSAELSSEETALLDGAAAELYEAYLDTLPTLRHIHANKAGTYFSRMISWPGKSATGTNQLAARIEALRNERRRRVGTSNFSDISLAGEADGAGGGLEEYAVSDTRTQGFPCLVHIDISVRAGALSLLAVYRHWHLITRGYGNLIGLARLQEFLCQQTGFTIGELAVVAGHANAEHSAYSGKSGVAKILTDAKAALGSGGESAASA
ncbi:hypothetical protein HTS88_01980 [Pseudarthrobacter oxydans]|uniref:hypothetical protein n=1 Tax=Pseudarthrobacter oxydans TaxID=1671 RepID=UPI001572CBDD|nr:hypothetical protein [Pseudarthrobacter oxydans]NSX35175.1 hypothetical protein [Pseudarthrobacter oxydans]